MWDSPMHLLILILVMVVPIIATTVIPVQEILHRAGHSRWWVVLLFVPLVNWVGLWVFAYAPWPALDGVRRQ